MSKFIKLKSITSPDSDRIVFEVYVNTDNISKFRKAKDSNHSLIYMNECSEKEFYVFESPEDILVKILE